MANLTYNSTSGYLYFTNYTINASKTGYSNNSIVVNLTKSSNITILLTVESIPVLIGITANPSSSSVEITWNTSQTSNSTVFYGTNVNVTSNKTNSSSITEHSITITGLSSSTLYYYNVSSCNALGCNTSQQFNFTTTTPPTTTTTLGGSGGGGGGSFTVTTTTTTTTTLKELEKVILPVEEIVEPVEVPTDLPNVTIPSHVPNKIITMTAELGSLNEGVEGVIESKNKDMAMKRAFIQVEGDAKGEKMTIKQLVFKPEKVDKPKEDVYRYFDISVTNPDKIKRAVLEFDVSEDWIASNNRSEEDVRLAHYADGEWKELPTKRLGKIGKTVTYEAVTEGFSVFAIMVKIVEDTLQNGTEEKSEQPKEYFSFPFFKAVLIGVLVLLLVLAFSKMRSMEKKVENWIKWKTA